MKLHRLKLYEWLILVILYAAGFVLLELERKFIPEMARYFTAFLIIFAIFLVFYLIVGPASPFALSRLLSIVLVIAAVLTIVIVHMIISFDVSLKHLPLVAYVAVIPYLAGWLYGMFGKKR